MRRNVRGERPSKPYDRSYIEEQNDTKCEHTAQGPNARFVVTNRRGLAADRLSCHAFRANACRLLLHAFAYDLLHLFRLRALPGTALTTATLGTIRLSLLKLGARVVRSVRRWWFHLATCWPGQPLFGHVLRRLRTIRGSP